MLIKSCGQLGVGWVGVALPGRRHPAAMHSSLVSRLSVWEACVRSVFRKQSVLRPKLPPTSLPPPSPLPHPRPATPAAEMRTRHN
ncbi:hypothetical protein E2C01_047334 [Portunus trituberculatus]|uniref:Uncharacterized protein n=1 Tax=Portunus trituberculatus TaxID=210409 RepID=A0A5B7G894_PORTR|nr:hypothetical protein [Portunus trituberculatus]